MRRATKHAAPAAPSLAPGDVVPADRRAGFDGTLVSEERYGGLDFPSGSFAGGNAVHTEFVDCLLAPGDSDGVALAGARMIGCRWTAPRAASLDARDVRIDNCEIVEPRFGAADLHGAVLDRVAIDGGKIDYLNLRGATVKDFTITGAVLGEIDLGEATVGRLRFVDARVGRIDVRHATLASVDLRGAELGEVDSLPDLRGSIINDLQLYDLAPALADHLGIEVSDG
ncbi:pentapeptide repeat-containing protein [Spelaeicoccus albus]|uniref:Uncharacterized protein YjbI with pentapeptide repeats n=2 Tax=Spelaeicoccus albus TaxID=1280376 RepID=A0A7Z0AAU5_9MICO|nr:uncharacterized protein YjbI with pentapeptide repeats [Spelaeicoccus albus]